MLQSGNGCDELTLVIGKGSRKKAAQKHFNRRSGPERTTDSPSSCAENPSKLSKFGIMPTMKYWEVIAEKLSGAGWSWSYCSAVKQQGWR
jgi:hypothetical protein